MNTADAIESIRRLLRLVIGDDDANACTIWRGFGRGSDNADLMPFGWWISHPSSDDVCFNGFWGTGIAEAEGNIEDHIANMEETGLIW